MSAIYHISALAGLFIFLSYVTNFKMKAVLQNHCFIIITLGLLSRILLARLDFTFSTDIDCFKSWAVMLFENGFGEFYGGQTTTDYPPGYMYVLYIIGALKSLLSLDYDSKAFTFLIQLPAMLADVATALLIYRIACRKMKSRHALLLCLAYVLNPAVLIDSAVWGQVDAVHTLLIMLSLFYLSGNLMLKSFVTFTFAVLIKPQSLIFSPIYLFYLYCMLKQAAFNKQAFYGIFKTLLVCLLVFIVGILPFSEGLNLLPVIIQYFKTLASYPYASVNAYNVYTVLGLNWTPLGQSFLYIPLGIYGAVALPLIVVFSFRMLSWFNVKSNLFYTAAWINFAAFMLSVKMHERYLFPALLLLIIAYIYKREKHFLLLFAGLSLTLFVNCADVLYYMRMDNDISLIEQSSRIVSLINIGLFMYSTLLFFKTYERFGTEKELFYKNTKPALSKKDFWNWEASAPLPKLGKKDYFILAAITFIYSFAAFNNLGNSAAPESPWIAGSNDYAVADFGEEKNISLLQTYLGYEHGKNLSLQFASEEKIWSEPTELELKSVFAWKDTPIDKTARFVRINSESPNLYMQEIAFRDSAGGLIPVRELSKGALALFDEQSLVPDAYSYMNSSIFDEVYHARTAYEYINHLPVYEWTHPPLGKVLISSGIALFGMNPFGWRFMGTLSGVLMLAAIYVFSKKIFKRTFWAAFSTVLFALDAMHFVQTRIATIDSFVTLFIILMYYFMYEYISLNFKTTGLLRTFVPLCLSGIFMGLAVSVKWQGVYSALGLALIFFLSLYGRFSEYRSDYPRKFLSTIAACFVFFIAVPSLIYIASYFMFLDTPNQNGLQSIWQNQLNMFSYHAYLVSEHPYASPWWSWPFMLKPILYYSNYAGSHVSRIISMGNPIIWYAGIAAVFFALRSVSGRFSRTIVFLLIAFLSQYLPWVFVSRTTYIYHYFPSVPFMILLLTLMFEKYIVKKNRSYAFIYLAAAALCFAVLFPSLSGL